ncbi:hypothetical protein SY89_00972 [Halolamina pelagica]|uniref:Uncharacterized protein n=1 Tax=Halolamina pelagica TaxID=699431 RepID=A0A0P7GNM5_9EURY|nr:hypothetical protein SY89_00972 [Halolamina pelagica]
MKEYKRKQLLERVGREAATIGADIPEQIEVQGETLELQQFVFEIKRRETVPAEQRERVDEAKRNLRRERNERLELLEDGEISHERGRRSPTASSGSTARSTRWNSSTPATSRARPPDRRPPTRSAG